MVYFSDKQRAMLAKQGFAMPDGGYPIRNRKDLRNAIQAYGRSNNKDNVKQWIKRRAKQLDAEDMLPENWRTSMNKGQSHFRAATTEYIQQLAKGSLATLAMGGLTMASTKEGRAIMKSSVGALKSAIGHSKPYINYLKARYGAGYYWASPANEALKAIGNKIIVDTVTSM